MTDLNPCQKLEWKNHMIENLRGTIANDSADEEKELVLSLSSLKR